MARTGRPPRTMEARFWSKVQKADGCWLWQAGTFASGYGIFRVGDKLLKAHRVAYELYFGPIPVGLCACHRCDVRACVNPGHLFLGTRKDNNADRDAKGRTNTPKGEAHGSARLTAAQVRAIRASARNGKTHQSLAADYGVCRQNITDICLGRRWKHLKGEYYE